MDFKGCLLGMLGNDYFYEKITFYFKSWSWEIFAHVGDLREYFHRGYALLFDL